MTLSSAAQALLSVCAQHMNDGGEDRSLDLFAIRGEFLRNPDECVALLAAYVERMSDGEVTARKARYAMVKNAPGGIETLFISVLPASTPKDVIKVSNSTPYILSPGTGIGCARSEWRG